jgi:hypothetical protein
MKFKAYIEYSVSHAREAKRFNDKKISGSEIEFTFEDIVGYYSEINGKIFFMPPSFSAREIIIPWLQKGNIPLIVDKKYE